jgi:heme oxygenase
LNHGQLSVIFSTMKTLEAERAAQNFARFLKQVHLRQESFRIVKEGVAFAYLVPASEGVCNSHGLADDLAAVRVKPQDRQSLARAVRRGQKTLKPLRNPWG